MVIAFDTWILDKRYRNTGINTYVDCLFREFRRLASGIDGVTICTFSSNSSYDSPGGHVEPGFETLSASALRFPWIWRVAGVAVAAARAGADVIFSPALHISPFGGAPVVSTIHDVMPARLPADQLPRGASWKRGIATRVSINLSQTIVTDSQCSKDDLVEIYGVPADKVSVIYLGYDKTVFNCVPGDAASITRILQRYNINRPYILHHGMVQLRKNLGRLIEAFDRLADARSDLDFQLVMAGPFGWGAGEIREVARRARHPEKIVFTGPVPTDELALLIKSASLVAIPSLYEGFCLPMVEAMACGLPVIASNASCLPEVSGKSLLYFDPFSVEEITSTIVSVLDSSNLQAKLRLNGLKRASEFSWERCAREVLSVLIETGLGNGRKSADTVISSQINGRTSSLTQGT